MVAGTRIFAWSFALVAVAVVALGVLATPAWAQAELAVDKTSNPGTVVEGEEITYTIVVRNSGSPPASATMLTDSIPSGTRFVSVDPTDRCRQEAGTVKCDLGTIDQNESETVTIKVRATGSESRVQNTAKATSPDATEGGDSATTRVLPKLEIVKIDRPDPVRVGALLLYTMRVTNIGSSVAENVVVTELLNFDNVDFVEIDSGDFACERRADRIRCELREAIEPDQDRTIELNVRPRRAGTLQNTATVRVDGFEVAQATTTTTVTGGGGGNDDGGGGNSSDDKGEDDTDVATDTTGRRSASGDVLTNDASGFSCEQILRISTSASADQYDFSSERLEECRAAAVIDKTIPRQKTLAKTGGAGIGSLAPIGALLLLGAGIFLGRSVLSRRED